ncbi:ribosomal protein S12 methylthiotransferase RimO [Kribbella orskensis]|uniref:Ribosomal protein uS12 methylthiotransferase RimO n=1 Tax=Kribbella orskensis TaxID=2512216 RepID=A0ABY2BRH4_9ACTN|nr:MULTISPECIES: 30S ribosomal protein S12 methylthiotransferase RimO [Kribbella]TCN43138.1 ribosomal protein S12 methylthiotransferase RimO [Kribbella sp. VKM Ac-2500]TCO29506.1 ribosomal protein S12 methylthiotransferase RimO [Kribbella orskensis]
MTTTPTTVALVTLGCARNDVDSEELAGRLEAGGFRLVDDAAEADTVVVNTCGFVEAAKKDSVDTLLAASDYKESGRTQAVVAVGCLAERYGEQLAEALPETDAVLGFDDYADISERLRSILSGTKHQSHVPRDRRKLLPLAPADRANATGVALPGHGDTHDTAAVNAPAGDDLTREVLVGGEAAGDGGVDGKELKGRIVKAADRELTIDAPDLASAPASGPRIMRRRLDGGPMAPLKLASGCDRRCAFCAIPAFRGAFVSRRPTEVLGEAHWLAENGVREVFLVSENSTSYGKDLGDLRLLETLVAEIAEIPGLTRVRVSYLQPAEMRPTLISAMASTPGVAPYFDLSFQHASGPLLRRMRRFGDAERFLELIEQVRAQAPTAGIRSNVIVGFPGETEEDVDILCDFLSRAGLDAIGVFGYSDEDGTEAETYDGKLDEDTIAARLDRVTRLAEDLTSARAESRIGETVEVLVESIDGDTVEGRAAHQGPEVDGSTTLTGLPVGLAVGDLVSAEVVGTEGVDLIAEFAAHVGTREGVAAANLTA